MHARPVPCAFLENTTSQLQTWMVLPSTVLDRQHLSPKRPGCYQFGTEQADKLQTHESQHFGLFVGVELFDTTRAYDQIAGGFIGEVLFHPLRQPAQQEMRPTGCPCGHLACEVF